MYSIDQSKDLLHMLEDQEGGKGWGNYSNGQIHSALGKWDEAIKYFNKAIDRREGYLLELPRSMRTEYFKEMKDDSRIKNIIETIGLPY